MKILILILVFGLMLLPIAKLRLKPEQKRIAKLRQHAIDNSLQVQFAATPSEVKALETRQSIRYQYLHHPQELKTFNKIRPHQWLRQSEQTNENSWLSKQQNPQIELQQDMQHILATLPDSVNAVEITSEYIGCYWFEEGDIAEVAQISLVLKQLKSFILNELS